MESKISVLMGIYNCADTLEEAVQSIQNQTYSNWELIMCDDGSTDCTYQVAYKLTEQDSIIRLLRTDKNCGLNKTLNSCLNFEKQLEFLEQHSEYDIVSSSMILFDENGEWGRTSVIETPCSEDIIAGSPICHAPVMMRKCCMDTVGGYTEDKRMIRVEDVNLWIKLYAAAYRCYNLQEPLYMMRNDQNALQRRKYKYRVNSVYVRLQGCKVLHLGPSSYVKAIKPMLIGLVPAKLRHVIRRIQQGKVNNG